MDWNLKTPSWELTGYGQETIPNINVDNGAAGSSSLGCQGVKGGFSVDLKLGQVVHSGDSGNEVADNFKVPSVSKMAVSPSGSSKRARAINNGIQMASCLVDGCNADLSNCREYHRRHKVCELHSKTAQVKIGGQKQRFCQQCSRFHSLEEFDKGKRSCRKRLDGHNRRRRKSQPESLSRTGSFLSNYQGTRSLPFSSPQGYPTASVASPIWPGIVKTEEDAKHYYQQSNPHLPEKQNPFPESSSSSNKGGKQISFLHSTNLTLSNQTVPEVVSQPFLKSIASAESGGVSDKMFCDGLSTQVPHSDCALSLLSLSPTQRSGISLSHAMQLNQVPIAHPLDPALHYNSLQPADNEIHCHGLTFHMGPDMSSGNETPQTLPFYWE